MTNIVFHTFPCESIGGAAARFADVHTQYLESPWQFLATSYLTCLGALTCDKVTMQSEIRPQPRLYTVIVGQSADDRKSEAIRQVTNFFIKTLEGFALPVSLNPNASLLNNHVLNLCEGVGSAEGLASEFKKHPNLLLCFDELKTFVSKAAIENAILLPCVTSLFEKNTFQSSTKRNSLSLRDVYLSILAACTVETFQKMWTPAFLDIGFINRLFLVTGKGYRRFAIPKLIPDEEKGPLKQELMKILEFVDGLPKDDEGKYRMPIDHYAFDWFDAWYQDEEHGVFGKRLDTFGQRLLILFAINEMQDHITLDIVKRVEPLLLWQYKARKFLDPDDSETMVAKIQSKIMKCLSDKSLTKRDLERACHKSRVGTYWWKVAINGLLEDGQITLNRKKEFESISD
jgi:hypothetical protein